jgi:hypothetical protein
MWPHRANPDHKGPGGYGRILANWEGLVIGQRGETATKLKQVFDHPDDIFNSTHTDRNRDLLEQRSSEWLRHAPQWHRQTSAHEFASTYCYGILSSEGLADSKAAPSPDTWYAHSFRINVVHVQEVSLRAVAVSSLVAKTLLLMPDSARGKAPKCRQRIRQCRDCRTCAGSNHSFGCEQAMRICGASNCR